jgi:hypothetical protein
MNNIEITVRSLLWVLGAVTLTGGAAGYIIKALKPLFALKKKVDELEENYSSIESIKEDNKILCEGILCLLDHAATNNSIDDIKKVRKKLQAHLVNRG